MTEISVRADEGRCVGAGRCVISAPDIFDSDDDGIVTVLRQPDESTIADVREAVRLCPGRAISLEPGPPGGAVSVDQGTTREKNPCQA
ncbi:ferredoxin [Saccharothrix ecbatanensis]|uniref:Ferredoxin n=1 Tax=Saccharothrix ecbatanensis TaxID=1105145 RepID=A0A7W9HJU9_9PSEU|nr:ferredoxin [Saccharothrix ecbatanensis]